MSENPLYYSGSQTSKPSNLKPALSAALASLEVQLDEELARYRRTRIAHKTPIQKSLGNLIAAKPIAQNATSIANNQNQQSLTGEQAAAYIRQQQGSNSQAKMKTPPPPPPPSVPKNSLGVPENKETNSENRQITFNQSETVPFPEVTTVAQSENTSRDRESSIVKADINRNTPYENIENIPAPKNETAKLPDDYLESSEALLRSLAEEQQQPSSKKQKEDNSDSLLSPLSIGSMLLLLVSSITFGYIIFNFENLPSLTFGGLFKRNSEVQLNENTKTVSNEEPAEAELTPIPKNPNLANDALPGINNIDDVAGATPKAKPTQAAQSPSPVISPAPVTTPPTVAVNTPAEKPISEPQVTPTPQNLDEIKPSNNGFYNVIVDNAGDTLNKVKQVIPDAYLSPEGKYVYLGAFKSKQRVKRHLELLKENGITARVEEPN